MSEFKTVRGMRDFVSEEAKTMKYIERKARKVAALYGYKEIITPVVESYELLSAKAGEDVRLRMYTFQDLGKRMVALRPELTPSVARVVATTLKNEPKPFRLFCTGSSYRYDEPQRGRYREFWQSDFELMGSSKPEADAEILLLTNSLMKEAGLKKYMFKIGHVGVFRGILSQDKLDDKTQNAILQLMDKKQYGDAFKMARDSGASDGCLTALQELVKLKGFDASQIVEKMKRIVEGYEKAMTAVQNLDEILKLVSESRIKIDTNVEAGFARGLEYYTGMILEVNVPELDVAVAGGGRYDRLIELFGGEPTPAVGIAHGIDRIMLAMQEQKASPKTEDEETVAVISVREELRGEALRISQMLRNEGIAVEAEVMGRKMTKALEDADRRRIGYAIFVGEHELKQGAVVMRDLKKREQRLIRIEDLAEAIQGKSTNTAHS